jgi:hypothetical protein
MQDFTKKKYLIAVTCYYGAFIWLLFNPVAIYLPHGPSIMELQDQARTEQIDSMSDAEYLEYLRGDAFFDMKDKDRFLAEHHKHQRALLGRIQTQLQSNHFYPLW